MKFEQLVKITLYKPTTLARAVLYGIGSDRLLTQISNTGYEIDPAERCQIVQVAAGNKEVRAIFESSSIQDTNATSESI